MTWVKLDDRFTDNPKVASLSDRAFRTHVEALCYVAGSLTDGRISPQIARRWSVKARTELVRAYLWDADDLFGGYTIHDYLDYNPPRTKVVAEREAKAKAGAMGAAARWGRASATADSMPPSRPVPSPKARPTGGNPDQPTHDQMYLRQRLAERFDQMLSPAAIVKLNQAHGVSNVESAMRDMHGFPPEDLIRSLYAYVETISQQRAESA